MGSQVILAWRRRSELSGDDHLLDGYFDIKFDDGSDKPLEFEGLPYPRMIGLFANHACEHPEASLYIQRLDQEPEPVLMKLEDNMAKLLREDPVSYIRATSPPARVIKLKLGDSVKATKVAPNKGEVDMDDFRVESAKSPIQGGYDTIAESFGDDIFCRVSGDLVECPNCGRWARMWPAENVLQSNMNMRSLQCDSCLFKELVVLQGGKRSWAVIPTEVLLQNETTGQKRFFIPRAWNKDGPWIKYEELKQRYEAFCKERRDAQGEQ